MVTIGSTLRSTAARVPDRDALVFEGTRRTYRELDEEVDRVARVLIERGVRPGDRLALLAPNSDRFVVTFYAAHRAGAIFVPVNPASAGPEVEYIVRDSGASVLVFDPELVGSVTAAGQCGLPAELDLLSLGTCPGHEDLFALAAEQPADPVEDSAVSSDDAQILYTSGTTGNPKGATFDHHRVMWEAVSMISTCGMQDGDRFLHVAPLYHSAELCIMLIPGTLIGVTHVVHRSFDPALVLDTLEREQITMLFGVPTMYQFLADQPSLVVRDLSHWRTAMFGAAPMPAAAVERLIAALPHVNLIQLCGQTEAGPNGIFSNRDQVRARPDASGRQAIVGMECRVVDDSGEDVGPGGVGELLLRGESLMKGYWNRPDATAETIVDGWLHTGDICRVDPDGYMTVVDRLKDLIITGGRNVYSVEVEGAVAAHPSVADVAVVGRPHPEYGESIVAAVVLRDNATVTLDELRDTAGERIARYKLPHELVVVDQLPRNASGKLLKREIRRTLTPLS